MMAPVMDPNVKVSRGATSPHAYACEKPEAMKLHPLSSGLANRMLLRAFQPARDLPGWTIFIVKPLRDDVPMTTLRALGIAAVGAILLAGCGMAEAPGGDPASATSAAGVQGRGELVGRGTVLQKDGELPRFCLGPVEDSYPPQCSGPVIRNWDWSAVKGSEAAAGVTWGPYEVTGTWDGTEFTRTRDPIPLSRYGAAPPAHQGLEDGPAGAGSEPQLRKIQIELHSSANSPFHSSWTSNGYLVVNVIHDAGTLQRELDTKYGPNLILVQSALRPAS